MTVRRLTAALAAAAVSVAGPGVSARAAAATPTWRIIVDGTLVNSSANPTAGYQAPQPSLTPGHSVTMSLTVTSSVPYQLAFDDVLDLAGTQPTILPAGVSIYLTGAACSFGQGGGNMHGYCDRTPAGTHTFGVVFSVSADSPFLYAEHHQGPRPSPYAFLEISATPTPLNQYGASSGDFGVQVLTGAPAAAQPAAGAATRRAAVATGTVNGFAPAAPAGSATGAQATGAAAPRTPAGTATAQDAGASPAAAAPVAAFGPSGASGASASAAAAGAADGTASARASAGAGTAAAAGSISGSSSGGVIAAVVAGLALAGGGVFLAVRRRGRRRGPLPDGGVPVAASRRSDGQ